MGLHRPSRSYPCEGNGVPPTPEVAESVIIGPPVTVSIAVAECVPSASLYVMGYIPGVTDPKIVK